jgi:predicted NAD/FAD-binding protein
LGNQRQCRGLDPVETISGHRLRPYPDLTALFGLSGRRNPRKLHELRDDAGRFEWKGGNNSFETAPGLFAQPRKLLSPSYLWMLRAILTFTRPIDDA